MSFESSLDHLPQLMGILNITPDSFSDGGKYFGPDAAIAKAQELVAEGTDLLDVGAESSAQDSREVPHNEEWRRLEPVLRQITRLDVAVSVDTWKAETAEKALASGVRLINDVTAGRGDPRLWDVLKHSDCRIVYMFSKDASARTTLRSPDYADPIATITRFFQGLLETAAAKGIDPQRIILDPGMGAFLSAEPRVSFQVLKRLDELKSAFPQNQILVGTSRKGFLRAVNAGRAPEGRLIGSVITALAAARRGADILRVHDVRETREALQTEYAIEHAE